MGSLLLTFSSTRNMLRLKSTQNSGVQGTKSSAGARGVLAFPFPSKRAVGPPTGL